MGDRRCCCGKPGCELGEDNFDDRDDGPVPADDPKWKVLSGDWDFDDGTVIGDGLLATRICHPAAYPLGSFVATFTLKGIQDNPSYGIRCGDPVNSDYEVWFEADGFGSGLTGTLTITVYGDDDETATETLTLPSDTEELDAKVCYAPGLHLLGMIDLRPNVYPVLCIGGSDGDANCYQSNTVGNFSFLEGHFDDWVYVVHWIENNDCPLCDCFCRTEDNPASYSCLGRRLTLSIVSDPDIWDCPGAEIEVTMYRMDDPTRPAGTDPFYGFYNGGSTTPKSWVWVSDSINCSGGHPFSAVRAIMLCGMPIGLIKLALVKDAADYSDGSTRVMYLGNLSSTQDQAADAESTCEPLELIFPGVGLRTYQCQDTEADCMDWPPTCSQFACCGPCFVSSEAPTERFLTIYVTD
jgi:hypothetical protein